MKRDSVPTLRRAVELRNNEDYYYGVGSVSLVSLGSNLYLEICGKRFPALPVGRRRGFGISRTSTRGSRLCGRMHAPSSLPSSSSILAFSYYVLVQHKRGEVSLRIDDTSRANQSVVRRDCGNNRAEKSACLQLHLTRRTRTLSRFPWDVVMFLAFRFLQKMLLLIVSLLHWTEHFFNKYSNLLPTVELQH